MILVMTREIEMLNHVKSTGRDVVLGKMATEKYNSPTAAKGNPTCSYQRSNHNSLPVIREQALKRNHANKSDTRKIRVNRMP